MKLNFAYMEKSYWSPTQDFYAIKVEGVLYPCTYSSSKTEAFIYGKGWKKSNKSYLIPLFTGETCEEADAYLKEYGAECMFYSFTGKHINDGDCVIWASSQEFKVALSVGFDYVSGMMNKIEPLNQIIRERTLADYGIDIDIERYQWTNKHVLVSKRDLFKIIPHYSLMAYFLTKPNLDPVSDDSKLWKHFVSLNGIKEGTTEVNREDEFPVSVKDRLTYLFGEEVSNGYEKIMNDYPMA